MNLPPFDKNNKRWDAFGIGKKANKHQNNTCGGRLRAGRTRIRIVVTMTDDSANVLLTVDCYRFPTGESGSDVFDRVKSWWYESVLTVNNRIGYEKVDALVVVTHGLTMRFILMQLFNWSPTTFHSVWNADNCAMYVLQRDLTKPGLSPYVLDQQNGDMPRSSIEVMVRLKHSGVTRLLKLEEYLSIPPPRTTQISLIKCMLEQQYPSEIKADDIDTIVFMPFVKGSVVVGRSTSGVCRRDDQSQRRVSMFSSDGSVNVRASKNVGARTSKIYRHTGHHSDSDASESECNVDGDFDCGSIGDDDDDSLDDDGEDGDDEGGFGESAREDPLSPSTVPLLRWAKKETSSRFPCIKIPGMAAVET